VDEAIFLSDRVVMMTDGPEAEVGDILSIPFERPRNRKAIMEDPRYYELRAHLIDFLNERSHLRPSRLAVPFQADNVEVSDPSGQMIARAAESA
jgi:nitrate/nitrite transport system ATP-binding protein